MRIFLKALGIIFYIFISTNVRASDFSIVENEKTIQFKGAINTESVKALLNQNSGKKKIILIDSEGGDASAGLMLGRYIVKNKLSVIVNKYCYSACANYVFLSASRKFLLPGGVLGFHGGITLGNFNFNNKTNTVFENAKRKIQFLSVENEKYFRLIGVNKNLITKSFELTKPKQRKTVLNIETTDRKYEGLSESEGVKILSNPINKNSIVSIEYTVLNASTDKFYFPSEKILNKYGVKGIVAYAYPKSQAEMSKLGSEQELGDFELIGDFE